ncbi:MAG: hypothetical protein M0R32_06070 [Candidatus Cloacimonetes bacterium]|jgi:hypothetical protein|nr:hypothetical protein [Candidatus Cloacimonadota bacterium]
MQVSVIKDQKDSNCQCSVIQLNEVPSEPSDLEAIPRWRDGVISILVPTKFPSVTCQVDENARIRLENCYVNSISFASDEGFESVKIPMLGVDNLYWDSVQSAGAARKAIVALADSLSDDFLVEFFVSEEDFEIWDDVMKF